MSKVEPLYEDSQLKVTYHLDSEENVVRVQSHELWVRENSEGEYNRHLIQRDGLRELAFIARDDLEGKLNLVNRGIVPDLRRANINIEAVGMAAT